MYGGRGFYAMRAAGGGANKTIVNPIMLRFRPIAPKPVAGTSGSGEAQPEKSGSDTNGRRKRKYVRGKRDNRCKTKKPENGNAAFDRTVLEPPVCTSAAGSNSSHDLAMIRKLPVWLNFDGKLDQKSNKMDHDASDRSDLTDLTAVVPQPMRAAESWVTVECVTDAFDRHGGGGAWLGKTDVERMKNLELDTCPAFVSDGTYSVRWINQAYREMVVAVEEEEDEEEGSERRSLLPETTVKLVVKEGLPAEYPAFACRVTVEYYTLRKSKRSRTMPCDVWKMDYGGFAWRLDVQTALSLGR
ncbi:hypothetical protein RHGRI_028121 [Rhododendron griersonianum]|uniref:DUF7950 domain-containing protein n=1 Tax=Rhododendron griersonianum TaxID=479676 RepID=A0AAV6II03_9ERIC|nr:hypothetical protein RHGRI_028121 [Rhododendron griersonianum]